MRRSITPYSRRAFLKCATSSTLVALLSALSIGCGFGKLNVETIARRMIETLNHHHRARELGAALVSRVPELESQSYESLTRKLLATLEIELEEISHDTLESLDALLHDQVRRDFLEENVVIVEGFMLSRTEALLCSLAFIYA